MSRPVTHQMIAQRAGVSQATVSFALRNHPKISAATRQHVQAVAAAMNYRPNPEIAHLMTHIRSSRTPRRQAALAFVYTQTKTAIRKDEVIRRYFEGARARAESLGYALEPCWLTEPGMTEERMTRILINRGITGVVLGPLAYNGPVQFAGGAMHLGWEHFATAAIGRTVVQPDLDRACHDNFSALLDLMRQARQLGYRRIGLAMNYKADERVNHLWIAGFLTSVHEHPELIAVPPLVAHTWGPEPFLAWIRQHQPDCVISHGIDVCEWLADAGLRMPDDIGYATVSWNSQKAAYAGTYQNYELIGAEAVNIVFGRLNRNERGLPENPHIVLVKGRWVSGPSLGRPPAPPSPADKPAIATRKKTARKRALSTPKTR